VAVDAVKALAHPGRLRILAMLRGGDLCVCQMTAVLELAASTVSSHLGDLRRAGFVSERKRGKWVHYHLVHDGPLADLVEQALRLVGDDDLLTRDVGVVRALRKVPLETFCRTGFDRSAVGRRPQSGAQPARPRPSPTRRQP
jgi:DNA-binding transcriptional ArsR family regulator